MARRRGLPWVQVNLGFSEHPCHISDAWHTTPHSHRHTHSPPPHHHPRTRGRPSYIYAADEKRREGALPPGATPPLPPDRALPPGESGLLVRQATHTRCGLSATTDTSSGTTSCAAQHLSQNTLPQRRQWCRRRSMPNAALRGTAHHVTPTGACQPPQRTTGHHCGPSQAHKDGRTSGSTDAHTSHAHTPRTSSWCTQSRRTTANRSAPKRITSPQRAYNDTGNVPVPLATQTKRSPRSCSRCTQSRRITATHHKPTTTLGMYRSRQRQNRCAHSGPQAHTPRTCSWCTRSRPRPGPRTPTRSTSPA